MMRRSDTSSWPTRQSSNDVAGRGVVTTSMPRPAAARESSRARAAAARPRDAHGDGLAQGHGRRTHRVATPTPEPSVLGHGGCSRGEQVGELAVETFGQIDGAAAGQRPQRGCGRQLGDGADVDELQAHSRLGRRRGADAPRRRPSSA